MPEIDLIVIVECGREIVLFDFPLTFTDIFGARHVPEIEIGRHWKGERLETPAAVQLDLAGEMSCDTVSPWLLPINVERQCNRRHDAEWLTLGRRTAFAKAMAVRRSFMRRRKQRRLVALLEVLVLVV